MKAFNCITTLLYLFCIKTAASFNAVSPLQLKSSYKIRSSIAFSGYNLQLFLAASNDNDGDFVRPDLVGQNDFMEAVEVVQMAVCQANGVEYVKEGNPNVGYAIGRIQASLSIPPGIDLIETPNLVLVNGVNQEAKEAGIEPLDTIVGVSVGVDGVFDAKTKGLPMDETVVIIKNAIAHAKESGIVEISLELNRLIKGLYK